MYGSYGSEPNQMDLAFNEISLNYLATITIQHCDYKISRINFVVIIKNQITKLSGHHNMIVATKTIVITKITGHYFMQFQNQNVTILKLIIESIIHVVNINIHSQYHTTNTHYHVANTVLDIHINKIISWIRNYLYLYIN